MKKLTKISGLALLIAVLSITLISCTVFAPKEHYENSTTQLTNPNATPEAQHLMDFLKSVYGKYMISGQYVNEYENFGAPEFLGEDGKHTVFKANEMQAVYNATGKYPAILGVDISGLEQGANIYSLDQIQEWGEKGGICLITWHWKVDNKDGKGRVFYTNETDLKLKKVLKYKENLDGKHAKEKEIYDQMVQDIHTISKAIKEKIDRNIPILWRPLHEASGGWFWWGSGGKESYLELWDLVYDIMVNEYHLDNLIWVTNPQDKDWYVGDDKCDLVGDDPYYYPFKHSTYEKDKANSQRFGQRYSETPNKMIMCTENDFIPDPALAFESGNCWLAFMSWCREYTCKIVDGHTTPEYGGNSNTLEELQRYYADPHVITLDEIKGLGYDPSQVRYHSR